MRRRRLMGVGLLAAAVVTGCSRGDGPAVAPASSPTTVPSSTAPVVVPPPRPGPDGRLAADQWPDPCTLLDRPGATPVPGALADGFALPDGLACRWSGAVPVEVRLEMVSTDVQAYWDGLLFRTMRYQEVDGPWDEAAVELTADRPTLLVCVGMTVARVVAGTWTDDAVPPLLQLGTALHQRLSHVTAGQAPPG